jgi:hypothetical protein
MNMKRVILLAILGLAFALNFGVPANAGFFSDKKALKEQAQYEKNCKKDILEVFAKQGEYVKKYDIEGLKSLYAPDFVDNDGYNKDVYFSLVGDTWETYPDITYTTKIKNIKLNGDYATVETEESAVATSDELDKHIIGELNSYSNCIYHLQKLGGQWEIIGENVTDEFSTLKYGDARYLKMTLETPRMIGANKNYAATLKVEAPENSIVVASLNQEKIVNPATKPEEHFMKLREDNTLARIFTSNTDNINEYIVASIGVTGLNTTADGNIKVLMNGLAFVMSRVNVVPTNNFARVDDKKDKKDKADEQ